MSNLAVVVMGDPLSNGGTVISGSLTDTVGGKVVARKGDLAQCAQHGPTRIAEGSTHHSSDGIPVALHQHRCDCGCLLIAVSAGALSNAKA